MLETASVNQQEDITQMWADSLACPLDHAPLSRAADGRWSCTQCSFVAPLVTLNNRLVSDFRCKDQPQTISLNVQLPTAPLNRDEIARSLFLAPQKAKESSRAQPDVQINTKLDKGCQHYLQQLFEQYGPALRILDLGCGNGDNRKFLHALGFQKVLAVDWESAGADILVDAHRLPLADKTFDVVVSTAVFEHLYNPFVAMSSIGRVSADQSWFIGGASFWEAWHGSSYFHLTPDGWNALLTQQGFHLDDLWVGWGIVPAALAHVLVPGHLRRFGYRLQALLEQIYRLWGGDMAVRKLQLRASGSYMVYASRNISQTAPDR